MSVFGLRDQERLAGVHPALVDKLGKVFAILSASHVYMFVVMGVRTQEEQQALYAQGRTAPGPVVTMADGIVHKSNHQPHADGFGYAVDCAFYGPSPFDNSHPWQTYGLLVEAQGLVWGGRWSHPHDSPHAELKESV